MVEVCGLAVENVQAEQRSTLEVQLRQPSLRLKKMEFHSDYGVFVWGIFSIIYYLMGDPPALFRTMFFFF